jgi:L-ectoine synthase
MMEVEPMIVRTLEEVAGTERDVAGEGWRSRRLMLRRDGLGFSLHDTTVEAGSVLHLQYKHHLEACYCLEGEAEITDESTGGVLPIRTGSVYALDQHDRHTLRVRTDLRLVCVFNPALTGGETHDAEGSFPPPSE